MEILMFLIGMLIGVVAGIFLARFLVKREFAKNPPISEEMIAAMLSGMGQPATKKRVKQIMKQMTAAKK